MGASVRRGLAPALVVLALVGVVVIAAGGSVANGSNQARQPPHILLDTVLSLLVVALVPATIMLLYGLFQRKEVSEQYVRARHRRSGLIWVGAMLALLLLFYLHRPALKPPETQEPPTIGGAHPAPKPLPTHGAATTDYVPHFAWLPVAVVVSLVAVAALAWYLSARRKRELAEDTSVRETLASVLDDTLDDLRRETDARKAVIAAYARLERALAASGVARRPSETQEELLGRVLERLKVTPEAVRRLTTLFERAKFSQHTIDAGMKEEAIGALEAVRDELRAAEAARGGHETSVEPRPVEDQA